MWFPIVKRGTQFSHGPCVSLYPKDPTLFLRFLCRDLELLYIYNLQTSPFSIHPVEVTAQAVAQPAWPLFRGDNTSSLVVDSSPKEAARLQLPCAAAAPLTFHFPT